MDAKRATDVVLALLLLVLLSPVLVVAMLAVRLTMGAPVLFRQERPGLTARPFVLLKLRTMREATDADGRALGDAERLTPLGRWLRATSIDELPSLWNVVRGDMSLVGPRPLLTAYLERYTPRQARRHEVRPGITGLAQVSGRNALDWDDKLELDVVYVERRTWRLDLTILLRTLTVPFRRGDISTPGHATAPEFPGSGTTAR